MQNPDFHFEWKGFGEDRAVGFLSCSHLNWLDGKKEFELLEEDDRYTLQSRFDAWIDCVIHKHYYHGFDKTQYGGKYTACFQFGLNDHRFYGFLCHPSNSIRFQLCALAIHARKRQWNVEEKYLKKIVSLSNDSNAIKAINASFVKERMRTK